MDQAFKWYNGELLFWQNLRDLALKWIKKKYDWEGPVKVFEVILYQSRGIFVDFDDFIQRQRKNNTQFLWNKKHKYQNLWQYETVRGGRKLWLIDVCFNPNIIDVKYRKIGVRSGVRTLAKWVSGG